MMTQREALESVMNSDECTITPAKAAPILGSDPHTIRVQARLCPERLGFPVIVARSRVKIPRIPFLKYIGAIFEDGE